MYASEEMRWYLIYKFLKIWRFSLLSVFCGAALSHKSASATKKVAHKCTVFLYCLIKVFRSKEDNGKLSDSCDPCSLCRGLCQPSSPGDKVRFVFVITFWDFNRCNFVICRYDNACHFYFNLPQKISITSTKDLSAKKFKKNLSECLSFNIIIACLQAGVNCGHASATWWAEQGPCEPMSAWESQSKP